MKKILLVMNLELNGELLQELLEPDGWTVVLTFRPKDGIEQMKNQKFDLIISDRSFGNINAHDGLQVQVKAAARDIPYVLLSSWIGALELATFQAQGVLWVVEKPFHPDTIIEVANRALTEKPETMRLISTKRDPSYS